MINFPFDGVVTIYGQVGIWSDNLRNSLSVHRADSWLVNYHEIRTWRTSRTCWSFWARCARKNLLYSLIQSYNLHSISAICGLWKPTCVLIDPKLLFRFSIRETTLPLEGSSLSAFQFSLSRSFVKGKVCKVWGLSAKSEHCLSDIKIWIWAK